MMKKQSYIVIGLSDFGRRSWRRSRILSSIQSARMRQILTFSVSWDSPSLTAPLSIQDRTWKAKC